MTPKNFNFHIELQNYSYSNDQKKPLAFSTLHCDRYNLKCFSYSFLAHILNIFNIVSFKNEECRGKSSQLGTCYTSTGK